MSGQFALVNDRDQINAVQDLVIEGAEERGFPHAARFALRLAIEEAIVNAFKHGHQSLPDDTPITVEYDVTDERVMVAVEDRGPGFAPSSVPDPTLDENLENPGGRGLVLMRAYMSKVRHNDQGNRVEMELAMPPSD